MSKASLEVDHLFDNLKEVGQGVYGTVFRAEIKEDNMKVRSYQCCCCIHYQVMDNYCG